MVSIIKVVGGDKLSQEQVEIMAKAIQGGVTADKSQNELVQAIIRLAQGLFSVSTVPTSEMPIGPKLAFLNLWFSMLEVSDYYDNPEARMKRVNLVFNINVYDWRHGTLPVP